MNLLSLLVAVLLGGMGVHFWVLKATRNDNVSTIVAVVVMVLLFVFGADPVLR